MTLVLNYKFTDDWILARMGDSNNCNSCRRACKTAHLMNI